MSIAMAILMVLLMAAPSGAAQRCDGVEIALGAGQKRWSRPAFAALMSAFASPGAFDYGGIG